MKLKKVMALCNKSKVAYLMDRPNGEGEPEQWLGDTGAMYRLEGMPCLEGGHLAALFGISEKARDKWTIRHKGAPDSINLQDTDPEESLAAELEISVIYDGVTLTPLETRHGIIFIQSEYLEPLEDVWEVLQLYERVGPHGTSYIAAKAGLMIAAVIWPYNAINERFVKLMKGLTRQCGMALDRKRAAQGEDTTESAP